MAMAGARARDGFYYMIDPDLIPAPRLSPSRPRLRRRPDPAHSSPDPRRLRVRWNQRPAPCPLHLRTAHSARRDSAERQAHTEAAVGLFSLRLT